MSSATEQEMGDRPLDVAPLWRVNRIRPPERLDSDMKCDTIIVGGGVSGLSAAAALSESHKVILLEERLIGEGSTGWSAGILSSATTVDLDLMESIVGEESTRQLAFFFTDAVLKTKTALGLSEDDWQTGKSIYLAARQQHSKILDKEIQARRKYGLPATYLDRPDLLKPWPGAQAALELADEHAVHPVKALLGILETVVSSGSRVFEGTKVESFRHEKDRFIVKCGTYSVEAENLVICAGLKSSQFGALQDVARAYLPVVSNVLVTEPSAEFAALFKQGSRITMWDTLQLYHYVRYLPDGRVLVGGEDEPGGIKSRAITAADPAIARLHRWASARHKIKLPPPEFAWQATLAVPLDGLPLLKVKLFKENVLLGVVTDGLPFGFLLGNVVARIIKEGEHPVARLVSHRRPLAPAEKLLSLIPAGSPLRNLACQAGFAALRLKDWLA